MSIHRLRTAGGFSLLELMITVAIVGILAAIAIPSYMNSVTKSRRSLAQSCLAEHAQFMERFYTLNLKYHEDKAGKAVELPDLGCAAEIEDFFDFELSGTTTATAYTLSAKPEPAHSDATCGTMTLTNTGAKGAATSSCWP